MSFVTVGHSVGEVLVASDCYRLFSWNIAKLTISLCHLADCSPSVQSSEQTLWHRWKLMAPLGSLVCGGGQR